MNEKVRKIVMIGPESTGKSRLGEGLSTHYNTLHCPEYAREYLLKTRGKYDYDDLLEIARGQLRLEEDFASRMKTESISPPYLFIDTDMIVMKVWCEFVFNKCHRFILDQLVQREYDLYLLCNTDIPWVKDSLREYPDLRTRRILYQHYKDFLINQSVPWTEISGDYPFRLRTAIKAIDKYVR